MKRHPFLQHERGPAAAKLLVEMKQRGAYVPVAFVMGADAPDVTLDVFRDVLSNTEFVAVMRYGTSADVLSSDEDYPHMLAGLVLSDGYEFPGVARRAMRRFVGWMAKQLDPEWRVYDHKEIKRLAAGKIHKMSRAADVMLGEAIWDQDPNEIAVAMAQAFDP